jgi:hypothetical protein
MAQRRFHLQHQLTAFIKDNGDIVIKGKPEAVLPFEDGTELGTLDYFDVHSTKVEAATLPINGSNTEILCLLYDAFPEQKYALLLLSFGAKPQGCCT